MKKKIADWLLDFKVVHNDFILKNSLEGIVYNDTIHKIKAGVFKPVAYINRNFADHKGLVKSIFNIKPKKEQRNMELRSLSWEETRRHAEQVGKMESTSNTFEIDNLISRYDTRKRSNYIREIASLPLKEHTYFLEKDGLTIKK